MKKVCDGPFCNLRRYLVEFMVEEWTGRVQSTKLSPPAF
jgi:hypothetical protein